jgi:predicted alpha/beta-fold hydrolase
MDWLERALRAEGPEEYDECITRRLHGYDSVEQMYKDIGCDTLIQDIKVPVLLLGSKKDPISPYFVLYKLECRLSL